MFVRILATVYYGAEKESDHIQSTEQALSLYVLQVSH